jgi:hypothetical protein
MPVLGTRGAIAAGAYEPKSIGAPYWASSFTTGFQNIPVATNNGGVYFVNNSSSAGHGGIGYINPNGQVVWQKSYDIGTYLNRVNSGIAVDIGNNAYSLLNSFSDPYSRYIYKIDQSGTVLWQNKYNFNPATTIGSLYEGFAASTIENALYVAGINYPGTGQQLQVIRISTVDGSVLSQVSLQNTASPYSVAGVGVAPSKVTPGVYYVCGYYYVDNNNSYPFLAKYNGTTLQWQVSLNYLRNPSGGYWYNQDFFYNIQVDKFDNIYLGGQISKITTVSSTQYAITCGLVAKYNTSGTLQWQQNIQNNSALPSSPANTYINIMTIDGFGNLFVGLANLNGDTNTGVFKYNTDGTKNYSKLFTPNTYFTSVDTSNNLYAYGYTGSQYYPYICKFQNDNSTQTPVTMPNVTLTFPIDNTSFVNSAGVSTPATTSFTAGTNVGITVTTATGTFANTFNTATVTRV